MKFQNPSFKKNLNGWTDACRHGHTDKPKPICSVGGIKTDF